MKAQGEGSLQAPTRHPLNWKEDSFWQPDELNEELARVFDICHGCRRCVSLCDAFPTLFDLVDDSETLEVDGVDKKDYNKVVDQCYLCDLCYLTKCPYVRHTSGTLTSLILCCGEKPRISKRAKHAGETGCSPVPTPWQKPSRPFPWLM